MYLNFCEKLDKLPTETIEKYRKFLKLPRHNPDVYVPSNDEVLTNYHSIKRDSELNLVFLILATSGVRYVECVDFLNNYDPDRFTVHEEYASYPVAQLRRTKNTNNIYLPLFVYERIKHVRESYYKLCLKRVKFKSKFSFKYLRKWQYNFLLYNNVPESVCDFIQGRSSKSISANHYLAKSQQASFWYAKVASKFKELFINNTK